MNTDEHDTGSGACEGNAAPYVLGALDADERAAFRRHLESCAVCREEVASLRAVASSLAAVAPAATAPPELKERLMSTVRGEAREPELRTRTARRPSRAPVWRGALAFAALLLVLAVAVLALDTGGSGGTRVIRAQVLAPHASAQVSLNGDRAELTLAGMPQSAPGRVYEVWVKRSGAPQPTDALFTVTTAGDATVGVPGSIAGVSEVLVSSEPLGGSRVPTRTPVIVARLG